MEHPKLAAVILHFNRPTLTIRCLKALRESGDVEIYLVDNGGLPATIETLKENIGAAREIRLPTNVGFSAGMNAGLKAAFQGGADFVVALSNDVEVDKSFIEACTKLSHKTRTIYGPLTYFLKSPEKVAYTHGSLNLDTWQLEHHISPNIESRPIPLRFPQYYPAAATVWTRSAYEALRGFDEDFFCYWEDVDLSFRASIEDVELVCAPQLKIRHLGRGTTGGRRVYTESHFQNGRSRLQAKVSKGKRNEP